MENFIATVGSYLTPENIAWFLGAAVGLEQVLGFTKIIKSNSSLELGWNLMKFVARYAKEKKNQVSMLICILLLSACASLPPVDDIREQLDAAEITLVVVEEIAAELEIEGIATPGDVEKLNGLTNKVRTLIETASLILDEGNRKDAIATLIKLNRLIVDLQRE